VQRGSRDHGELIAVADAAMVLPPRHFVGVGAQVRPSDMVVDALFGAAQAGEIAFRHVGARAVERVRLLVIDAFGVVFDRQHVPVGRLVRVDRGIWMDKLPNQRHAIFFSFRDEWQRAALAFAHDDDDLPLAGLVFRQTPVAAVLFFVRGFDVAAEVRAVDFHMAVELGIVIRRADSFAELVTEHECRLVLHAQVAAQLERGIALCTIGENRNGGEDVSNGQLAAGKDRARRDGELGVTGLAFEDFACRIAVDRQATATRAIGVSSVVVPTDRLEGFKGGVVRHTHNPSKG